MKLTEINLQQMLEMLSIFRSTFLPGTDLFVIGQRRKFASKCWMLPEEKLEEITA
jgi:hypothetical protein